MKPALATTIAFLVGGIIALVLTSAAWDVQIEGRAYECKDSTAPFATFHTNMLSHRNAGDRLIDGWTWERIERVGKIYRVVFFVLWFAGGGGVFVALRKENPRSLTQSVLWRSSRHRTQVEQARGITEDESLYYAFCIKSGEWVSSREAG